MVRYSTLALAGLTTCTACAAADAAPETDMIGTGVLFHIPSYGSSQVLSARGAKCFKGQLPCDSECIDKSFVCCNVGQGQACQQGYSCYSQGCCRDGLTCSGPPKGCTPTTKECDIGCIPKDRVCCGYGDGSSCDNGTVCLKSGLCARLQTELGPGSDTSDGSPRGPSQTSTSELQGIIVVTGGLPTSAGTSLKTLSDTAIGASVTSAVEVSSGQYSLSPVTTTSDGESDTSSETSSADKSKSTTSPGSSSTSSDKGGAGTTLKAPAILAGLLAAAAYVI